MFDLAEQVWHLERSSGWFLFKLSGSESNPEDGQGPNILIIEGQRSAEKGIEDHAA